MSSCDQNEVISEVSSVSSLLMNMEMRHFVNCVHNTSGYVTVLCFTIMYHALLGHVNVRVTVLLTIHLSCVTFDFYCFSFCCAMCVFSQCPSSV